MLRLNDMHFLKNIRYENSKPSYSRYISIGREGSLFNEILGIMSGFGDQLQINLYFYKDLIIY
jgi:hypothetical protein